MIGCICESSQWRLMSDRVFRVTRTSEWSWRPNLQQLPPVTCARYPSVFRVLTLDKSQTDMFMYLKTGLRSLPNDFSHSARHFSQSRPSRIDVAAFVQHGKKVGQNWAYNAERRSRFFFQIVAIGRNYSEHVKELGNTAPKEPFFFLKPTTSYLPSGGSVLIPQGINAHYEGT